MTCPGGGHGDRMVSDVRLVATRGYLAGAAVTLHSFRTWHPDFDGTTKVYYPSEDREQVAKAFAAWSRLELIELSPRMRHAVADALPDPTGWAPARLYGLEMLAMPGDGDTLLLDADLLFVGSVDDLAGMPGEVVASPEGAAYAGMRVHRRTNEIVASPPGPDLIDRTFNTGVVRLRCDLLGPDLFDMAMSYLDASLLAGLRRRQHDQFVLNRLFEGRWQAADPSFNYLLRHRDAIYRATGRRMSEARVLHFNREPRPWAADECAGLDDPAYARAVALWHRCFAEVVEAGALLGAVEA